MANAARKFEPVTLEEFQSMAFDDRRAELIGGVVVVAQAFPTSRHGRLVASLTVALALAIRDAELACSVESGTGLDIRLETDFRLGPDLMVRCGGAGDDPGAPVLVAEVLSPSNSALETMEKLRAYQSVETLTDILILSQDRPYVEHWSRRVGEPWSGPARHLGPDAAFRMERLDRVIPLASLYPAT